MLAAVIVVVILVAVALLAAKVLPVGSPRNKTYPHGAPWYFNLGTSAAM
jgi:hypothetical protein